MGSFIIVNIPVEEDREEFEDMLTSITTDMEIVRSGAWNEYIGHESNSVDAFLQTLKSKYIPFHGMYWSPEGVGTAFVCFEGDYVAVPCTRTRTIYVTHHASGPNVREEHEVTRYWKVLQELKDHYSTEDLKLFVWEGVLCDHTPGIAFAQARNEDHAKRLIIADHGPSAELEEELKKNAPQIHDGPVAYTLTGGG